MLIAKRRKHKHIHATIAGPEKSSFLWVYGLIRIGLGGIFVWSGITKFLAPQEFAIIIESYGLIPDLWVPTAAIGLSLVEILAGMGLIIDLQWSLGLVTVLLVFFMVILSYGLWMGLDADCGCFGPEDPEGIAYRGLRPALLRDLAMLSAAVGLFFWRQQKSISPIKLCELIHPKTKRR